MANTKITNPELFNLGDSTSATQLPVMTTTQRIAMNPPPTFNVDYLVVAGGASGANQHGGGGGAGGLRTSYGSTSGGGANAEPTLSLTTGTSYSLTVGDGGTGVTWVGANLAGNNGYDSVFNNITSIGGGGGSSYATQTIPSSGGSGGGGGSQAVGAQTGASGEPGQGYAGGSGFTGGTPYPGGGGGGAGGLGGNATTGVGGNGGDGLQNDITVTTTGTGPYYAGGGGSATYGSGTPGTGGSGIGGAGKYTNSNGNPGNPQTGSGGGGTNGGFPSGSGGSGIVVLRYPTADVASYTATGLTPTKTTVGTDTVLSFTTVGTGAITFTSSTPTSTISTGEMIFNSDTDKVEYFDGTKWYGITYEADPADIFQDGSNLFTSNFSNSTLSSLESGITYRSYGRSGGNYFIDNTIPVFRNDLPSGRSGFGKSLTLTDTGDDPTITIDGVTPLSSVLTFSFWVYVVAHDNDDNVVLGVNLKRQNNSYMWVYIYEPNRSSYTYDSFSTLPTGSWQHMVVTKRSDNYVYTYKNNSLLGSINAGTKIPLPAGPFLGSANEFRLMSFSDADVSNEVWITGVRIFNRGLTASEITTLYNENPTY
jgi:hypothetical protein